MTYTYDDIRLTFTAEPGGDSVQVTAIDLATGRHATGQFVQPLAPDELALDGVRAGGSRNAGPPPGAHHEPQRAEDIGRRLADALFTGDVGALFDRALDRVEEHRDRGLRLSLSLGRAPALLDMPWEFLYVRPLFLASQRRTPVVRVIENDRPVEPVTVDGALRVLGVVSSPAGLAPLDVAAERADVETATATMRESGRLQLDWLDAATPAQLRRALGAGVVHVLHFVGHSDLTAGGGVIYLTDDDGGAVAVDEVLLANIVADASPSLGLVVLNSCKSGRSTPEDPQAGVAATLMSLGLPAVVGMQRAISDRAAITFAGELYAGLIDRREPIDVSVSEARKAIYADGSSDEWATPVLFVRDPAVPLFSFAAADDPPQPTTTAPVITVTGSGPVAIGGNVTITGGTVAGRDVVDPDTRRR
ncbi:CHAT domain-containing protein [Desertimonas flava]|uniref:CHAT domain-containing protein n=1 Tax=Desertimonas flava TaxID=2064846 RepID=UPI000E355EFD|nr:CHAT domain-containing protein [Desertimonas flava]